MIPEISVVIPVYKGQDSIAPLVSMLHEELNAVSFEVILVVDGCPADSDSVCRKLAQDFENVNYVSLRKNFGEFNAVICGLNYVNGKYAVIIDDDFQNPPSEIIKLYNHAKKGDYDVVYSYYVTKEHAAYRNWGSQLVNYLTTYLLKKDKDLYLSSFKLIKKEVVNEITRYKTPYPYIDGMIFHVTNRIGKVQVVHKERAHGVSNYTFSKLVNLFLVILFGYSMIPLRLTLFGGIFSIISSVIYMGLYFVDLIPEWGSPVIIFLGGILMCTIAILGEYMGKTYMIISGLPQYVIREKNIKPYVD